MKILELLEDTELTPKLKQGNLELGSGGNRNHIRFEGPVMQALVYHDQDYLHHGDESYVAVYDQKTHAESKIITLPRAGAAMTTPDEDGYTYFGTWDYIGLLNL